AARLTIDIVHFPHHAAAEGFHADEAAMCLDAGVRSVFQPAQWICAAGEVGESRFGERTLPKSFIEAFPESAERERIAEDQNFYALGVIRDRRGFNRSQLRNVEQPANADG